MAYDDYLVEELVLPVLVNKIDELIEQYQDMSTFARLHYADRVLYEAYEGILINLKELKDGLQL